MLNGITWNSYLNKVILIIIMITVSNEINWNWIFKFLVSDIGGKADYNNVNKDILPHVNRGYFPWNPTNFNNFWYLVYDCGLAIISDPRIIILKNSWFLGNWTLYPLWIHLYLAIMFRFSIFITHDPLFLLFFYYSGSVLVDLISI